MATGSVDQTGTYVFEVEPKGIGRSLSQISALWTTANGFDTMWNLLNPTNKAEDLVAIFYYGDGSGSYKLPIHLAAHGSTMIDMATLRMSQQPDAKGTTIPATVQTGSAVFESAKGRRNWISVVIASGIYNVVTATCSNSCVNCCGYSMPATMSPSSFSLAVGQSMQCVLQATDCQGYVDDIGTSYSSEDTSVMTVDNGGNVTAVAGGSTAIDASGLATVYTGTICAGWENPSCPQSTASGQAKPATTQATVQISSAALDPTQISAGGTSKLAVQIHYDAVSANAGRQSVVLESSTFNSVPNGATMSYEPTNESVPIPANGTAGVLTAPSVTVTNSAVPVCPGSVTVTVYALLAKPTSAIQVGGSPGKPTLTIPCQ